MDRFLPDRWGLSIPVTFQRTLAGSEPFYLEGTDVRADALQGVRRPHTGSASYAFSARRVRQATGSIARWLLDPLSVTGAYASEAARTSLTSATASNYALNLDYTASPHAALVKVAGLALRLNPSRIHFRSGLV